MKIVTVEFFNSLSEDKALAKFVWAAGKVVKNKFGKKIIEKLFPNWSSMSNISYDLMNDITDKTLEQVIDELDNFSTIFKWELNIASGDKSGIKASKLYLSPSIDNILIGATLTDAYDGTVFSGGTTLNKYLDIKDNHPITRESDKIPLRGGVWFIAIQKKIYGPSY